MLILSILLFFVHFCLFLSHCVQFFRCLSISVHFCKLKWLCTKIKERKNCMNLSVYKVNLSLHGFQFICSKQDDKRSHNFCFVLRASIYFFELINHIFYWMLEVNKKVFGYDCNTLVFFVSFLMMRCRKQESHSGER